MSHLSSFLQILYKHQDEVSEYIKDMSVKRQDKLLFYLDSIDEAVIVVKEAMEYEDAL